MIDLLPAIIVPELTDLTIVARSVRLAVVAVVASRLWCSAYHAEHVLSELPDQRMIFSCIVTVTTGVPMVAFETLHLDIPLVVFAAKSRLRFR